MGSARREGEAIGEARGIDIGKNTLQAELISLWKKKGFSEEQIKDLLGL